MTVDKNGKTLGIVQIGNISTPLWPQFIGWTILVVGWVCVHSLTKKRELRKEVRNSIDAYMELLYDLEKDAREFHQGPTYNEDLARKLQFKIKRNIAKLDRYPLSLLAVKDTSKMELRQAITIKNFDSSTFTQQLPHNFIFTEIAESIDAIEDTLETNYKTKFTNGLI